MGVIQAVEQLFLWHRIPQAAVEALDKGILPEFTRCDVVPIDVFIAGPLQDRAPGELRPIVTDDAGGSALAGSDVIDIVRPFLIWSRCAEVTIQQVHLAICRGRSGLQAACAGSSL